LEFLLDEQAPAAIADFLGSRGHLAFGPGFGYQKSRPDRALMADADRAGRVVLTWNVRHFAFRGANAGSRPNRRHHARVLMHCDERAWRQRLQTAMPTIESEYALAAGGSGPIFMQFHVHEHFVRIDK
jgi:predicted RNA methylase